MLRGGTDTLSGMEIHAPDRPVHSFKDFTIHIAVVTVGILIALGLDGVREMVREHRLVRETRESFRDELELSLKHIGDEGPRVAVGSKDLAALADEAPELAKEHPEQIVERLEAVKNPYYFFSTNTWQASLSTGAMAHMATDEVSSYAWSAQGTRNYMDFQARALEAETRAVAYWKAHPHPNADQIVEGEERILEFARAEQLMSYVAPQTAQGYRNALAMTSR